MSTATWAWPDDLGGFGDPARWVLERLNQMGIGVEVDPRVRGEIAVDRPAKTLILSPDLLTDWTRAHWRMCRGSLYIEGGPDWAPEIAATPVPFTPDRHARVIPIFRRPW